MVITQIEIPGTPYENKILSDLEKTLLFILDQSSQGYEVYSLQIAEHFSWSRVKIKRIIDKLADGKNKYKKRFVIKVNFCPECLKRYNRVPKKCDKCGAILIHNPIEFKNTSEQPIFLIVPSEEGLDFLNTLESWGEDLLSYAKRLNKKLYNY
jgi:hypothetical protein